MLLLKCSVLLPLWAGTASAFFPFVTNDYCKQVGGCLGPSIGGGNTVPTTPSVRIKQRHSGTDLPHSLRMTRYLNRLTRKNEISKRDNGYPMVDSATPTSPNSAAINQDGSDFSYFATIDFGSGSTPLHMLLDTGADDTWVMGTSCTNEACQMHNLFNGADSSSFKAHDDSFGIAYGTGSVSGTWASDSVSFAGLSLTLDFGLANSTSNDFLNYPFDGILGLAVGDNTYPAFMTALKSSNLLKSNIFAVNLNRAADGTNDGEITFGALDSSKFTGDINYIPLSNTNGKWLVKCDGLALGNKASGLSNANTFIDTGTSYIFMPPADASTFHGLIEGSSLDPSGVFYQIPCDGQSDLVFTFNGVSYTVSTKDWVGVKAANAGFCISNLYPAEPGGKGTWLLGDTFLKNVYSVFDLDKQRVGFGTKDVVLSSVTSTAGPIFTSTSTLSIPSSTPGPTSSGSGPTSNTLAIVTPPASSGSAISPSSSSTRTSGGFDAAVTSTSSSPTSASETVNTSPSPSATTEGTGPRLTVNLFTTSLVLLAAIALGS